MNEIMSYSEVQIKTDPSTSPEQVCQQQPLPSGKREPTAEEREVANDLLQLAYSLPPIKSECKEELQHATVLPTPPSSDLEESCSPIIFEKRQNPASKKLRFSCTDCGKSYATSSNLSRHKQMHRNLESGSSQSCPTCGKTYISMPALSMHLLTHTLTHVCTICGKAFSRPWLLQGHLRSHTGEKPYTCNLCGKSFADRSNLRAHKQTHSSKKSYICMKCRKSFALKSYLNKHLESSCMKNPIRHKQYSSKATPIKAADLKSENHSSKY